MEFIHTIISVLCGIGGANLAGLAMRDKSLGVWGNSIAGFFGGGIGAIILKSIAQFTQAGTVGVGVATTAPGLDLGHIAADILSGGIGGGVLLVIVALIKNSLFKQ